MAVGDEGQIARFDGSSWKDLSSGTSFDLEAISGSGTTAVIVGERGAARRIEGATLTPLASGTTANFKAVWTPSADEILVAGSRFPQLGIAQEAVVYRASSSGPWTAEATSPAPWGSSYQDSHLQLTGLWGASSSDIYAIGQGGAMLHFDGTRWAWTSLRLSSEALEALAVVDADDAYAAGSSTLLQRDAKGWRKVALPAGVSDLAGLWAGGPKDVYAVGGEGTVLHYDGERWSRQSTTTKNHLLAVWGTDSAVYAVGENGVALRRGQGSWELTPTGADADLRSLSGVSAQEVYAGGDRVVLRYDGSDWLAMPSPVSAERESLRAVHAVASNELYALTFESVGRTSSLYYFETATSSWKLSKTFDMEGHGLGGSSSQDLYVVGRTGESYSNGPAEIQHFDGVAWSSQVTDNQARLTAFASAAKALYVCDNQSGILRKVP